MMIPKIIHYCWFGGKPLPKLAQECIESWRKFMPEYEIKQWDESNFDVNKIPYTREAYRQGKYAYVSDYARFEIIYNYGGVYFDTDVEVIRPMEDIVERGCFMGFEQDPDGENTPGRYAPRYCFDVSLGLGFGMTPQHPFMKEMIDLYRGMEFQPIPKGDIAWYKTIVAYTTEMLMKQNPPLVNKKEIQMVGDGIWVYPSEYFAPINAISRRLHVTENTRTVHRYMASWSEKRDKTLKDYIQHYLPEWVFFLNNKLKRRKYKLF